MVLISVVDPATVYIKVSFMIGLVIDPESCVSIAIAAVDSVSKNTRRCLI
jgi:hypothetical protein